MAENPTEQPAVAPDNSDSPHPGGHQAYQDYPADQPETSHHGKTPSKHRGLKRNLVIGLVIAVNLGMAATTTALLVKKPAPKAGNAASSLVSEKNITAQQDASGKKDTPASQQEHYTSQPLSLEFDYPIDWHISSDTDNKSISIASPTSDFVDATGRSLKARVEINLADKYSSDRFNLVDDSLLISTSSEAVTYNNPTKVQRASTNISFGNVGGDTASVDIFFISGNLAYTKGQTAGVKNYKSINPFIFMYINSCPEGHCQALSISAVSLDTYHSNPIMVKAKGIIQSMRFN